MQANQEPEKSRQCEEPIPTTPPVIGADLRLKQQVSEALEAIPGGDKLDKYFGITTGNPEQPLEEAKNSENLIEGLRDASSGKANLSESENGGTLFVLKISPSNFN